MKVLSGKAAFKGVAIGKVKEFGGKQVEVNRTSVTDVEAEISRFEAAKETASDQLGKLYEKAVAEVGEENAAIFEVHQMMLEDESVTAVVPVYEDNDHHPLRAKTLEADGTLAMYEKGIVEKISTNRQDLPTCYFLSHNFWVLNVEYLMTGKEGQQPWSFMGDKILPYAIDESIDIHHHVDLILAKEWIEKYYTDH